MIRLALFTGLIATAAIPTAHAAEALSVSLRALNTPTAKGPVIVVVEFSNPGDQPAFIYRPESPFGRTDDLPASDFLLVFDSSGTPVPYIGTRDYWGAPEPSHFIRIEPNQVLSKEVDISEAYAFPTPGVYVVRYATRRRDASMHADTPGVDRAPARLDLQSKDVTVIVDHPPNLSRQVQAAAMDCTSAQDEAIDKSLSRAESRTFSAANIQYSMYQISGEPGNFRYTHVPNKRFDRWFGKVTEADPLPRDPDWYASDNYSAIQAVDATFNRLFKVTNFSPLKKTCGCPGRPPEAVASAEDHNLYAITFCPRFFMLPEDDPVTSKIGALVHEMSHFYDNYSDGRSDYGYGKKCAQDLAIEDKATAVKNADNLEYFVMDTTPYDETPQVDIASARPQGLPASCL